MDTGAKVGGQPNDERVEREAIEVLRGEAPVGSGGKAPGETTDISVIEDIFAAEMQSRPSGRPRHTYTEIFSILLTINECSRNRNKSPYTVKEIKHGEYTIQLNGHTSDVNCSAYKHAPDDIGYIFTTRSPQRGGGARQTVSRCRWDDPVATTRHDIHTPTRRHTKQRKFVTQYTQNHRNDR
jgi:hypothetical protein